MRLTKLGHSCVRLEKDGATLVIDPGIWSGPGALDGASAVLVTHEHPDHLDADAIGAALTASSESSCGRTPPWRPGSPASATARTRSGTVTRSPPQASTCTYTARNMP